MNKPNNFLLTNEPWQYHVLYLTANKCSYVLWW